MISPVIADRRPKIVPSVLSADFANLARDVETVATAGALSVQLDVMDGHFVPNITLGPIVLEWLRKATPLFLDLHLMIENPEHYVPLFAKAGADLLTVHYEACSDIQAIIRQIKGLGKLCGVAIRPKTSVDVLIPLLRSIDFALVMTVEPGFGGQAFIPEMLPKVERLRSEIAKQGVRCQIQVDGGINAQTALLAAAAGATSLVAGSAVYNGQDPIAAFRSLQQLVDLSTAPK